MKVTRMKIGMLSMAAAAVLTLAGCAQPGYYNQGMSGMGGMSGMSGMDCLSPNYLDTNGGHSPVLIAASPA